MKFPTNTWEKLAHNKREQLTEVAQIFFHLLTQFAKLKEDKSYEYFNS